MLPWSISPISPQNPRCRRRVCGFTRRWRHFLDVLNPIKMRDLILWPVVSADFRVRIWPCQQGPFFVLNIQNIGKILLFLLEFRNFLRWDLKFNIILKLWLLFSIWVSNDSLYSLIIFVLFSNGYNLRIWRSSMDHHQSKIYEV